MRGQYSALVSGSDVRAVRTEKYIPHLPIGPPHLDRPRAYEGKKTKQHTTLFIIAKPSCHQTPLTT